MDSLRTPFPRKAPVHLDDSAEGVWALTTNGGWTPWAINTTSVRATTRDMLSTHALRPAPRCRIKAAGLVSPVGDFTGKCHRGCLSRMSHGEVDLYHRIVSRADYWAQSKTNPCTRSFPAPGGYRELRRAEIRQVTRNEPTGRNTPHCGGENVIHRRDKLSKGSQRVIH